MARHRLATPDDATAIATLHIASWQTAYRGALPDGYLDALDVGEHTAKWRQRLLDRRDVVLVAVEGDEVVAFCAVGLSPDADADATTWLIANLHVTPARRREGLGTPLFKAAIDKARANGATQVTLWVIDKNWPARRFYEKHGMTPDGGERREFSSGAAVDLVRYELRLAREPTTE